MDNIKVSSVYLDIEKEEKNADQISVPKRVKLEEYRLNEIKLEGLNITPVKPVEEPKKEEPKEEVKKEVVSEKPEVVTKVESKEEVNETTEKPTFLYGGMKQFKDEEEDKRMEDASKTVADKYKDHDEPKEEPKKEVVKKPAISKEAFEKLINGKLNDEVYDRELENKRLIYNKQVEEIETIKNNIAKYHEEISKLEDSNEKAEDKIKYRDKLLSDMADENNFKYLRIRKTEENEVKQAFDKLNDSLGLYKSVLERYNKQDQSKLSTDKGMLDEYKEKLTNAEQEGKQKEAALEKYMERVVPNIRELYEADKERDTLLGRSRTLDQSYGIDKLNTKKDQVGPIEEPKPVFEDMAPIKPVIDDRRAVDSGPSSRNPVQNIKNINPNYSQVAGDDAFAGFDDLREVRGRSI